jgi:hypothetical protein
LRLTAGAIAVIGDIIVQLADLSSKIELTDVVQSINLRRLAEFFVVNAVFIAPALHIWFDQLSKLSIPKFAASNIYLKTAYQILIDQTVGAAWITTGFFIVYETVRKLFDTLSNFVNLSASVSPRDGFQWLYELQSAITSTLSLRLWQTLVVGRMFWPIINFVVFIFVPLEYR